MKKFIYLFWIIIFLSNCSIPEKFGMPKWSSIFRLKILNDEYGVIELADEDSSLVVINDELVFNDTINNSKEIGEFKIDDPDPKTTYYPLYELAPDSVELFNGWVPLIPQFSFEPYKSIFEPYTEFEELTIASAHLSITLTNHTVIWFGNVNRDDPLILNIVNTNTDELVYSITTENDVAPDGGVEILIDTLRNVVFPKVMSMIVYGGSRGTDGQPAIVDTLATLDVTVQLSSIKASYVKDAKIPEQSLEMFSDVYDLDFSYPEIEGDFELLGHKQIDFRIHCPVPGELIIYLTAMNTSTLESVLLHAAGENSLTLTIPAGNSGFELSSDEYNILDFMTILPDRFSFEIYPTIGDTTQVYDLDFNDEINIETIINSVFRIQTDSSGVWIIPVENDDIQITKINSRDLDQAVYDAFINGQLNFEYLNSTGIEMKTDILFALDKTVLIDQIYNYDDTDTTSILMKQIPYVESTTDSIFKSFPIEIKQSDLDFFLEDSVFVTGRFNVRSEGDHPISGSVLLRGELELEILISEDIIE
ncbi:MAG: hypothetical protein H8E57_05025 [Candidatus Cloacimonetes bacterium]|nr:hypothetical protein [Candidatus Cloacimonadota bacterium]